MAAEVRIVISQSGSGSAAADAKKQITELGAAASESGGHFSSLHEIAVGALRHIGEMAVDAGIAGIKALAGQVGDAISSARESNQIFAQTEQVIKSTGGAAGLTAQQVADYASSLSAAAGKSLFGDEQIEQSENLLLTFTNIKGHALEAATAMSVDMAQAMGGAPKDAAIQLGKALNDPIKGISALSRVGVTFDAQQKKLIKTYVAHGEMAKAQEVILAELNKEFGGSAAAAAKADGGWAQFNDRMGEAKETIGKAILPLLGQLAGFLNDTVAPIVEAAAAGFSAWLNNPATQAGIQTITNAFGILGGILSDTFGGGGGLGVLMDDIREMTGINLSPVVDAFGGIIDAFRETGALSSEFGEAIGGLAQAFGLPAGAADVLEQVIFAVQGAIASAMATFSDARTPVEGLLNVLSQISPMFAFLRGVVEAALPPIQAIVESVFTIISNLVRDHGAEMLASAQAVWNQIQILIQTVLPPIQAIVAAVFGAIATFLQNHGTQIETFLATSWNSIARIVQTAVAIINAVIVPAFQTIASFLQSHSAEIQNILSQAWNTISGIVTTALNLIQGLLNTVMLAIQGDWSGAWETLKSTCASFVQGIISVVTSFLNTIAGFFGTSLNQLADLWASNWNKLLDLTGAVVEQIVSVLESLPAQAMQIGADFISGIITGVENSASQLYSTLENIATNALNSAKNALGISSPSTVFAVEVGQPIMQGIQSGMDSMLPGLISQAQTMASSIAAAMQAAIGHAGGSMAGAGVITGGGAAFPGGAWSSGGGGNTSSVSNTVNFNPTYNNVANAPGMDYALTQSMAGV